MALLKFIGGIFLLIFGLILLGLAFPTLVLAPLALSATISLLIVAVEIIVGTIMLACGIYISIIELKSGITQTVNVNVRNQKEVVGTAEKPTTTEDFDYLILIIVLIISGIITFLLFRNL
jgi:hypothetical protein